MRPSGWTAVVTAAGHATRFRPFSTIVPKEMLPIGHRPALEHVITECVNAGATTVIVATRPGDLIVPYLPAAAAPRWRLGRGRYRRPRPRLRQRRPAAHAARSARLPGDLRCRVRRRRAAGRPRPRGHARHRQPRSRRGDRRPARRQADISSFGVVDTHPQDPDRVAGIRQRPDPATVSTPLALVSRLILRPSIFDLLVPSERARGELALGIALGDLARIAEVRVHQITGRWVTLDEPRRYFDALRTYWLLQSTPTVAATTDEDNRDAD